MTIEETVKRMKDTWSTPHRQAKSDLSLPDFDLSCSFDELPASPDELERSQRVIPGDLLAFWKIARTARLFEDREYGQWGLEIVSPVDAISCTLQEHIDRPSQFYNDDLVVGRFIGDSDLLIIRCDKNMDDFGNVLIALPIDPRSKWYTLSNSFGDFLQRYLQNEGAKYWERQKD